MQIFKENPTLKRKKWPRPPCLANRFTEFSIDSIVQKLNSTLGASVWAAEGCIELSISNMNRSSQPSAHTPPLSASLCSGGLPSLGSGAQQTNKVKELCE